MKVKVMRSRNKFKEKSLPINQKTLILLAVFSIGLIFGSLSIRNLDLLLTQKIQDFISNYFLVQKQQTVFQNFISSLAYEFVALFIPFVFGLCVIGEPVMWLEPFVRGLGVGLLSGYLYKNFNLNGMKFFSLIILIPLAMSAAIMLIACHESILMTRDINSALRNSADIKENFTKLYIIRYSILLFAIIIISLISSVNIMLFSSKFNLQF